GKWTTTVDGDWTGGFWPGVHLLGARDTSDQRYRAQALGFTPGLKKRVSVGSRFQSFSFYFRGVPGAVLFPGKESAHIAVRRRPRPGGDVQSDPEAHSPGRAGGRR